MSLVRTQSPPKEQTGERHEDSNIKTMQELQSQAFSKDLQRNVQRSMSNDESDRTKKNENPESQSSRYIFPTAAKTLKDNVRDLLLEGKRSQDEEFQVLFRVFSEERIRGLVSEIREEKKS